MVRVRGIPVLGPFVFRRLCLPVAWRLKGLYDAVAVRQFLCAYQFPSSGTTSSMARNVPHRTQTHRRGGGDPDLRAAPHRRVGRPVEEEVASPLSLAGPARANAVRLARDEDDAHGERGSSCDLGEVPREHAHGEG